jgi:hypothetical protein
MPQLLRFLLVAIVFATTMGLPTPRQASSSSREVHQPAPPTEIIRFEDDKANPEGGTASTGINHQNVDDVELDASSEQEDDSPFAHPCAANTRLPRLRMEHPRDGDVAQFNEVHLTGAFTSAEPILAATDAEGISTETSIQVEIGDDDAPVGTWDPQGNRT